MHQFHHPRKETYIENEKEKGKKIKIKMKAKDAN